MNIYLLLGLSPRCLGVFLKAQQKTDFFFGYQAEKASLINLWQGESAGILRA